jgi:hypothetical protein
MFVPERIKKTRFTEEKKPLDFLSYLFIKIEMPGPSRFFRSCSTDDNFFFKE